MKLIFAAPFLAIIHSAVAQDFLWRFYDNGGCDHGSPAGATFPPNNGPPGDGTFGDCFSAPVGINWSNLEVNVANLRVLAFCNINCQGAEIDNSDMNCNSPPAGCALGSFKAFVN
ncbi:hypothetical protein K435DRAFT_886831 [Dendrothele bispora CBS 962.96]|uniref:Expansin-like EG45 domain-containing protein n=1 Tax=Dendrothele bispora (strain CBS 962.96) TaxID=1314807 RepID=A0A4S8KSC0_DENBC|nr:hypothetical protein K435DRAFT_886831 [Dendrothele bispora CBS 962.96]